MNAHGECCGWMGWAELAGIGIDGRPLPKVRPPEPASQSTEKPCGQPKPAR